MRSTLPAAPFRRTINLTWRDRRRNLVLWEAMLRRRPGAAFGSAARVRGYLALRAPEVETIVVFLGDCGFCCGLTSTVAVSYPSLDNSSDHLGSSSRINSMSPIRTVAL